MEAVAVFVAGVFAGAVMHALVPVAPLLQPGVDIVLVGVDQRAPGDGRLDDRFDRRLPIRLTQTLTKYGAANPFRSDLSVYGWCLSASTG